MPAVGAMLLEKPLTSSLNSVLTSIWFKLSLLWRVKLDRLSTYSDSLLIHSNVQCSHNSYGHYATINDMIMIHKYIVLTLVRHQ